MKSYGGGNSNEVNELISSSRGAIGSYSGVSPAQNNMLANNNSLNSSG